MQSAGEPDKAGIPMSDLIFVGIAVAFFVLSGVYVRLCEKL